MSLRCDGCKACQECYWAEYWSNPDLSTHKYCVDMTCSRKYINGDHDGFLRNNWLAPIKVKLQSLKKKMKTHKGQK